MKWVCWIEPGEKLPPPNKKESVAAAHGDNLRADADWVPCEHGGFLYLWGDKPHDQDPRDCKPTIARQLELWLCLSIV